MESVTSLLKIAGTIKPAKVQVIARADAAYDQAKGRVFVSLTAFAEPMPSPSKHSRGRITWLPKRKHVTEDLPREQAVDFTNEVFREWLQQVRASIPSEPVLSEKAVLHAPATTSITRRVSRSTARHA